MQIAFITGVQSALLDAGLLKYASFDLQLAHAHAAAKIAMEAEGLDAYSEEDIQDLISVLLQLEDQASGPPEGELGVPEGITAPQVPLSESPESMSSDENKPDQAMEHGEEVLQYQDKVAIVGGLIRKGVSNVAREVGDRLKPKTMLGKGLAAGSTLLTAAGTGAYVNKKQQQAQAPISTEISRAERKLRGY